MSKILEISLCLVVKERSHQVCDNKVLKLFPNCVDSIVASTTPSDRVEIVVADYGSNDWPLVEWLPEKVGHVRLITVPMEGDFSRGRGLNYAAAFASHNIILFLDADLLVTRESLALSCQNVLTGKAFAPICQDLDWEGRVIGERSVGFGALAVSKRVFEQAGKWPEFYSWGGEDTILFEQLQKMVPVVRHTVDKLFHQWHPGGPWKERFYIRPADADYFEFIKNSPK